MTSLVAWVQMDSILSGSFCTSSQMENSLIAGRLNLLKEAIGSHRCCVLVFCDPVFSCLPMGFPPGSDEPVDFSCFVG